MAERLTPNMLRKAMNLPLADRVALMGALRDSVQAPVSPQERLEYLAGKMQEVTGIDVRTDSRKRDVVTARILFAFVARREGYTQPCIGNFIGRDHSTVSFFEKRMKDVFALPEVYRKEIILYNKYIDSL